MGFFYPQWQKITRIGVTTPPTTTGYQVKVEVPWQPGMRDDFADLRFSDYYRTLPYWIETSTTRVTATVWIKLTEINEAAREFFCYYGNGGAISESSGTTVFSFFDHFLGTTLDTNLWDNGLQNGTTSVANSIGTVTGGTSGWQEQKSKTSYGVNTALRTSLKFEAVTNHHLFGYGCIGGSPDYEVLVSYTLADNGAYLQSINNGPYTVTPFADNLHSAYNVLEIKRISTTSEVVTVNGAGGCTITTNVVTGSMTLFFAAYGTGHTTNLNWLLIRNLQATEPTCTPAESGINTAFYQALLRAKHVIQESYPYTLAVSFVTDHMHLTWTEP